MLEMRAAALGLAWLLAACAPVSPEVVTLTGGDVLVDPGEQLPADTAAWMPVDLPDRWMLDRRKQSLEGWYRIPLPRRASDAEPWALFAAVYPNAAFYVNGVEIGRGGRMKPPISRNSFRSLYFSVPETLWREDGNWLHVRLVGTPGSVGRIDRIYVGPVSALLPLVEHDRLFRSTIPMVSVALCLVLASALFLTARTGPPGQRALAGALLCVAAAGVSLFAPDAPLPNRLVEWWVGSALYWSTLLFALGVARNAGRAHRIDRLWIAAFALFTVAFAAVPPFIAPWVWLAWGAVAVPVFVHAALRLLLDGVRQRRFGSASAGIVALALITISTLERFFESRADDLSAFSGLTALIFLLGFGGYLLVTLLNALRSAEAQNRVLDARVAAREKELALSYAQQRQVEHERALAEERTRLMRDMHDGTGGRLVSALSLLRSGGATPGALEDALVEAIDDLHLTIDSLRPGAMDLPSVLGLLRARLERQLRPHGVRLEWAIGDAGEGEPLSPDQVLNVIRIVQEAVSNALRHAGGSTVRVATGRGGGQTWFEIADDGRGGARPRVGGRGLVNLEQRAGLLGGRLELSSRKAGTRVRVLLPLRGGLEQSKSR